MSNGADVFFDQHRIRVVEDLDLAASDDGDDTVRLDPRRPSLTVRGTGPDEPASITLGDDQGDDIPVTLTEDNGAGFLELTGGATGPVVRFDARSDRETLPDPEVELADGGRRKASVKPGRINLLFQEGFPGLAADGSGTLTLTNRQAAPAGGRESCLLDGNDSALVLSTTPEGPRGDQGSQAAYGGGDVVVQSETGSNADPDVQVHLQGERDSSYGVEAGNRPRIRVDGYTATLELGRHRIDSDRPSRPGTARIRSEHGVNVLEMRGGHVGESQVVFTYDDGSGQPRPRGTIRSHPDGLVVYDAGGHEAVLFTDSGTVETRREVTENATI